MNATQHETTSKAADGCIVCKDQVSKRGLCTKHYEQYRRRRDSLTPEAAIAWEKELIRTGKLLPNRQGNKAIDDAFADDFDSFVAKHPEAMKTPIETTFAEAEIKNKSATKKGRAARGPAKESKDD